MTEDRLKQEFEIRKLKEINKQLMNTNTILNRQHKNLNEHFDRRIDEEVNKKVKIIKQEKKKQIKLKKLKLEQVPEDYIKIMRS